MEHAKLIDARENNWGDPNPQNFMGRIFDQFNRYSLAAIEIDPFMAVCNQRSPVPTRLQQYFRQFRQPSQPFVIGGTIYENSDLAVRYFCILLVICEFCAVLRIFALTFLSLNVLFHMVGLIIF
jgi:hypothetical protein